MVQKLEPKNILILGSSSSVAREIINISNSLNYNVFTAGRKCHPEDAAINNFEIDLNRKQTIDSFFQDSSELKYYRIFFLMGQGYFNQFESSDYLKFLDYHVSYQVNSMYLIEKICSRMENLSNLIFFSSVAATNSSFDFHYASAKSGVSSFITSYSRRLEGDKSMLTVSPSLIAETNMMNLMDGKTISRHLVRNHNKLTTPQEVARFVWALTPEVTSVINGRVLSIGNEY